MKEKGQILVSILIIMAVATLAFASAIVAASLSKVAATSTQSDQIYNLAETGAEEALIKLLRNPGYSGETMTVDGVTIKITVSAPLLSERLIRSEASRENLKRIVEVSGQFSDNILTIDSWGEVP